MSAPVFVALGGAGEIGMNLYAYGAGDPGARRWIIVDCGIGFGDMESSPGVELVLADPSFITERAERLDGIFATHAHEDHIGALGHLWPQLQAPIYARPFTAMNIQRKLEEVGAPADAVVEVGAEVIEAGPFKVRYQPVSHSIPESSMLVIEVAGRRIVHTGDFKTDRTPQLGDPFDDAAMQALGDQGVDVLVCDSTNVFEPGHGHSEAEVAAPLTEIIRAAPGAVAATTFASNVARLRTLAVAAKDAGRSIVMVGRAMKRMVEIAVATGVLKDFPEVTPESDLKAIPAEHLFLLVTGSQGEGRAALARIASGTHPTVELGAGDTVIFSSKTIPGNETGVYRIYNQLSEAGIRVVDERDARVHVSGHARRGDIEHLYGLLRPKSVIPMHGEHRHIVEHARLAQSHGIASVPAPNGTLVAMNGEGPKVIDHVETGRLFLDGDTLIGAMDGVIRARLKLARQGHVVIALTVDEDGELLADPAVEVLGGPEMADGEETLAEAIEDSVDAAVENASRKERNDDGLKEVALRAARRATARYWGKKPVVTVLVTRLED